MAIGLLATMWCMVSNATYIMVVILLVEETENTDNQVTRRKSLTNLLHNVESSTPRDERGSNSQL
jgi:hypothetical protein